MKFIYDVPRNFWGLFRSVNREIYMEALLAISDEYQYNNYYLSREACLAVLGDMCSTGRIRLMREEEEDEQEFQESMPRRILNWLVKTGWLRRVEDYNTMTTNIVIPDYAGIFIETFESLVNEPLDDTQIYIQNVYATLFSFQHDARMNVGLLRTALVNTRKLNKALQDMLHNMDRFFGRLLEQRSYGELLREHLEGYVEEVVKKKYHILKTSDNFYIYKMDIKRCLRQMRENTDWIEKVRARQQEENEAAGAAVEGSGGIVAGTEGMGDAGLTGSIRGSAMKGEVGSRDTAERAWYLSRRRKEEDVLDLIDQIERGFDDIERRIANMDREHSKYVRSTLTRLNYLLSEESDRRGLLIQLLNRLGDDGDSVSQERLRRTAMAMNLASFDALQENPLYKRRMYRRFEEEAVQEEIPRELGREEVLSLNQIRHRYSRRQIEEFIEARMEGGVLETGSLHLADDEEFEKLILAYDMGMRKNSSFRVVTKKEMVEDGAYRFPGMMFVKRENRQEADEGRNETQ